MKKNQSLSVGLVFDDSLDTNDGVAQYVKALGAWLSGNGHEVKYLVGQTQLKSWHGGLVYSLTKNLPVKFNGNRLSIPLPASPKQISRALKNDLDILHVMMPYSPFMAQKIINKAAPATAIIGTFHIFPAGRLARTGGRLLAVVSRLSLKKFSRFLSVSPAAAEYARQTFGIRSEIVPNPVDLEHFKTAERGYEPYRIVFLGRLVRRKGCGHLLRAFAELQRTMPDTSLIVAGSGPERRQLEILAAKLGIADSTSFLGYIKEEDKAELLAGAHIACFPSLYGESFGLVLIEAMAAGAYIVLGGNNPGYAGVLSEQPKLLIKPADTAAFVARLKELLSDPALGRKLNKWQTQTVGQYDINKVGADILNIYYESIARRAKTGHNESHGIQKSNG